MSSHPHDLAEPDARLEEVLADYLRAVAEGRPPSREEFLNSHPDVAEELQAFFLNRDFMEHHAGRLRFDVPVRIGDYELVEVIGSGTFGVVFKARDVKLERFVAIKLLRGEQWSSTEHVQRFRAEAQRMAKLNHDHIVAVYGVGEHEGRHYFVMKLIEGGSLAEHLQRCTPDDRSSRRHQRWTAELMANIARAVHDAHQRAILHRDLKPGNILLDKAGNPHITDFGLAKHLEEVEPLFELGPADAGLELDGEEDSPVADTVMTEKGVIVGTATYMSTEAAAGGELTTASDIYSLGVVLYEMLTGQVPIRGNTPTETLQLIRTETPPAPRSLNPRIDNRLERLCMKCLQRNPRDRYGSALGLARNLERWLADEPIIEPPDPFPMRCRLWCRRYPALAGLLTTAALLLVFVLAMAISVARARAARLEEEVLKSNAYAAQGVADRFLLQLQNLSKAVEQTVADKQLLDLLKPEDKAGLQTFLTEIHARYDDPRNGIARADKDPPFESWYFLNAQGVQGAMVAMTGRELGRMKNPNYPGRDYFHGAMRHGRDGKKGRAAIHISRIYEATEDKLFRFGISAPVYNGETLVGVVVASVITDPTMGLDGIHDNRRKAVLYGPKDSNSPREKVSGPSAPSEFVILVHPAYHWGGNAVLFPAGKLPSGHPLPDIEELRQPDPQQTFKPEQAGMNDYVDPVGARDPEYQGRWLAGFAPVGNTEMAVIVQQRYDDAIPPPMDILWGAVAVLLGFLFIMAIGWVGFQWLARPRD